MPSRTQIVCLHEGDKGRSIDPIFIRTLVRSLDPQWIRPWKGNNVIRPVSCGGRNTLIAKMPNELKGCLEMGGNTTLMVWADMDDDIERPEQLLDKFWEAAQKDGISRKQFEEVVFVFAKDRLENWIEFLLTGSTDESMEGPRTKSDRDVASAAKVLADRCRGKTKGPQNPPSLEWSCAGWRKLVERMKA